MVANRVNWFFYGRRGAGRRRAGRKKGFLLYESLDVAPCFSSFISALPQHLSQFDPVASMSSPDSCVCAAVLGRRTVAFVDFQPAPYQMLTEENDNDNISLCRR